MEVAGGDRKGGAAGAQADVGQGVRHLVGAVASVVRVAKPELAFRVAAPTLDAAVVQVAQVWESPAVTARATGRLTARAASKASRNFEGGIASSEGSSVFGWGAGYGAWDSFVATQRCERRLPVPASGIPSLNLDPILANATRPEQAPFNFSRCSHFPATPVSAERPAEIKPRPSGTEPCSEAGPWEAPRGLRGARPIVGMRRAPKRTPVQCPTVVKTATPFLTAAWAPRHVLSRKLQSMQGWHTDSMEALPTG